jgi:hypothetical protein
LTLQDISQQRPPKLTVQQASKIMGVTPRFLQVSLQHERFPFGTGVKVNKRWSYYINTERFLSYMQAKDMA